MPDDTLTVKIRIIRLPNAHSRYEGLEECSCWRLCGYQADLPDGRRLGEKTFPPTYEGGEYATETRQVRDADGKVQTVGTVLLDSVQSQANRLEMALLRGYDAGRVKMPLLAVDFAGDGSDPVLAEIGRLTALEAPHRMCDAIFRDSLYQGQKFREFGPGERLNSAKSANATTVFELCPTALIFGFWDSTGPRGGLGAKAQRALCPRSWATTARRTASVHRAGSIHWRSKTTSRFTGRWAEVGPARSHRR